MFCFQWQKQASIAIGSSQEEVECIHYPSIHATCVCCIHQLKSLTISQTRQMQDMWRRGRTLSYTLTTESHKIRLSSLTAMISMAGMTHLCQTEM